MKKSSKLLIMVLVLSLLVAMLAIPTACSEKKEAIIILPGIMGSNLIDGNTGEPLWAPIKGYNMHELSVSQIGSILNESSVKALLDIRGEKGALKWLEKMTVKPDGTSNYNIVTQSINKRGEPTYPLSSTYGTLEYYEKMYKYFQKNLGKNYDIVLFEYDWRLDNMSAAIRLENFIKEKGYDKVNIVAHSMGGILASTFIGRSEENRAVVNKFISLGTPYYGSLKAIRVPENPLSLLEMDGIDSLLGTVRKMIDGIGGEGSFDEFYNGFISFARNLPTIYQLMPYAEMTGAYDGREEELSNLGIITVDGDSIKDYNEVIAFLSERGFCESNNYFSKIVGWQNEQFVVVNGERVHASKLVDPTYFVGLGMDTELSINYEGDEMVGVTTSKLGDGTVPSFSASCGLPLDNERVVSFDNTGHGDLAYLDNCLEKIAEVITKQ